MIKLFKNLEVHFSCLFQQIWALIFLYFWPQAKSQKNLTHIYQARDGQRNEQTEKNQAFYQTTTLQTGPINQVDNDSF